MVKKIITLFLFFIMNISFSKIHTFESEIAEIFYSAKFGENEKISIQFLYTKAFIKDTLINNIEFKKFKWDKFKNYRDTHEVYYEFESYANDEYVLLNEKLNTIHKLKFTPENQKGIFFGIETEVLYKIDAYENAPSFLTFYLPENQFIFVRFNMEEKKMDADMNEMESKKSLNGGVYDIAAQILTKEDSVETNYDIKPGDELQLLFTSERIGFSSKGTLSKDSNFKVEEKKLPSREEVITMKCTSIDNEGDKKNIHFTMSTFSSEKNSTKESSLNVTIDETGNVFWDGEMIAKEQTYKLDFKIESLENAKIPDSLDSLMYSLTNTSYFSFSGITYDTLSGKLFPKALYINSVNYYTAYYLCYFPLMYPEYRGKTGEILYVKLNNEEYGKKR